MYIICCSESNAYIFVSLHPDMVSIRQETQNIAQNIHLTSPSSVPLVRYNTASAYQVFRDRRCSML
jgi:hypothetical protein